MVSSRDNRDVPNDGDLHATTTFHVRRAKSGDSLSLNWVIERFTPVLVAQATWRLGPRLRRFYDPEDLVNDAWARTLSRLPELMEREGRFTPVLLRFLSTAILNRVNNLVKKHLRQGFGRESEHSSGTPESSDHGMAQCSAEVTGALTAAVRKEEVGIVAAAIQDLDEKDREVIFLRGIEQRETSTVSEVLNLSPEAVAMRYHRALKKLRAALPKSLFDEID